MDFIQNKDTTISNQSSVAAPLNETNNKSSTQMILEEDAEDRANLIGAHDAKSQQQHGNEVSDSNAELTQSERKKYKLLKNQSASYIERMRFGGVGKDQSDSDEDELTNTVQRQAPDATPMTRRAVEQEEKAKQVKKLGPFGTFMSLLKGFVCTAILYLPGYFKIAGWLFQIINLGFSCLLTIYCAYLLIEVRKKIRLPSYSDIGEKLYGAKGRIAVNITLFFSQAGFCCAYVWFIVSNFHNILKKQFGSEHDQWVTASVCLVVFTGLCWVRKIEIFAQTHVFADIMILITLLYVIIAGGVYLKNEGMPEKRVPPTILSGWATGFGSSIYSYEGIGIILPVQDVTRNPDQFFKVVAAVIGFVGLLYIGFGFYCTMIWQEELETIITSQLDGYSPDGLQYTIIILFCFNLLFSYPLVLYPSHIIVENTLFSNWEKSKKRQWTKNLTRTLLVTLTVVFTMIIGDKIDKFLGILGAVCCTPIAFTFPAAFHLKAIAETKFQKWVDWIIIIFSIFVMIFCGTLNVIAYGDD